MNLPARAACQLVPQAMIFTCRKLANSSGRISISSRKMRPVSWPTRPSVVSRTARGCSKISLSMKCLYPPFSAMMGSHRMCEIWRFTGRPSKSPSRTPAGVSTAMSPSPRKNMSRVWLRMAGTSEATKYSLSPMPITTGGPLRATTILCGSPREMTASANTPVRSWTAFRTASSRFPSKYFSTRCAMTSVSVSVLKTCPSVSSRCLSCR